jgi:hypothetical protein
MGYQKTYFITFNNPELATTIQNNFPALTPFPPLDKSGFRKLAHSISRFLSTKLG